MITEAQRVQFWAFLPNRPEEAEACWEWCGSMAGPYGQTPEFSPTPIDGRRSSRHKATALRFMWELEHGRKPHKRVYRDCGNWRCVRPTHLRVGARPKPVSFGQRGALGESHPQAVLSDLEVARLRVLYQRGASQTQLALHFNLSKSAVCNLVHGKTRRTAGGPLTEKRAA